MNPRRAALACALPNGQTKIRRAIGLNATYYSVLSKQCTGPAERRLASVERIESDEMPDHIHHFCSNGHDTRDCICPTLG
jgi:hypothetical protein